MTLLPTYLTGVGICSPFPVYESMYLHASQPKNLKRNIIQPSPVYILMNFVCTYICISVLYLRKCRWQLYLKETRGLQEKLNRLEFVEDISPHYPLPAPSPPKWNTALASVVWFWKEWAQEKIPCWAVSGKSRLRYSSPETTNHEEEKERAEREEVWKEFHVFKSLVFRNPETPD